MANKEHLKILEQGARTWNTWRKEYKDLRPDLAEAKLTRSDLSEFNFWGSDKHVMGAVLVGIDLSDTDLRGADLKEANLSGGRLVRANLSGSNFEDADLHRADFTEANLSGVNFDHANLNGANLQSANLSETILRGTYFLNANLRYANLYQAEITRTVLGDTNLSGAKNLDKCQHFAPCVIDYQTLMKSGPLPEIFLRGCGLPEEFIKYIPSLFWMQKAINFYSVFISHSHNDEDFAKRLHADLQDTGVRCWFAPEDIKTGDKIRYAIDESIRIYDKLLIILSETSVQSSWVEHEVETALDKEAELGKTVLFPIRLDDTVMESKVGWAAKVRRERHIGDFRKWKSHDSYKRAFKRLLHDLRDNNVSSKVDK